MDENFTLNEIAEQAKFFIEELIERGMGSEQSPLPASWEYLEHLISKVLGEEEVNPSCAACGFYTWRDRKEV